MVNQKEKLSKSQKNKNYLQKLKSTQKFDDFKKKRAAAQKKRRKKKKEAEDEMPITKMKNIVENRRTAIRERVEKHRKKLKTKLLQEKSETNSYQNAYNSTQALGKAVKKTMQALPVSESRRKAVLAKIVVNMTADDRNEIVNMISLPRTQKQNNDNDELVKEIQKFYERDDISRISPKTRHVKQYVNLETGDNVLHSTRHMLLTVKEAFAIFDNERKATGKDTFGFTFFWEHRPNHVKLNKDIPHDMCMCTYHTNFIEAVSALHKCVPSMPTYNDGFVQQFLCNVTDEDCWFSKCDKCEGISIEGLKKSIGGKALNSAVTWMVWRKSNTSKRIEKFKESGKLESLLLHITTMSPKFLRHSYVKCEQSDIFNKYDRPRASNDKLGEEGMLQIDFAENFVCEGQDEVQSAHWNQKQLTLFTTAFYHNDKFQSKVFVSNSLSHTKETIIPYMYILLSQLPETVKILKIWSDGPSSQFKNRFIAAVIPVFECEFGVKIYWNYFATSHGKGCIDGIGATAKMIVRKQILSRKCVINCASDFVSAFNLTKSKIAIEEVTERDFLDINCILDAPALFNSSKSIRDIASAHQIQVIDGAVVTFHTSKQGYKLQIL